MTVTVCTHKPERKTGDTVKFYNNLERKIEEVNKSDYFIES